MNNQENGSPEKRLLGRNNNPLNVVSAVQISRTPILDIDSSDWWELAYCKNTDPNIFFPSNGHGVEEAKEKCAKCIVKLSCLEYAITNRIGPGVWGGTSERERRRIIQNRAPN